jgi:hypothetical protein
VDEEGILYADIDIEEMIDQKQVVDTIGRDTRFDVVSLTLNQDEDKGIHFCNRAEDRPENRLISDLAHEVGSLLGKNIEETRQTSHHLSDSVRQPSRRRSDKAKD